jgi:hypothetical protein
MRPAPEAPLRHKRKQFSTIGTINVYAEDSERMKVERREVGKSTAQRKPCVRRISVRGWHASTLRLSSMHLQSIAPGSGLLIIIVRAAVRPLQQGQLEPLRPSGPV